MTLLVSLSLFFYLFQFLSNFLRYSFLNFLSSYPDNNFTVYFSGNSLLLNSSTLGFNFTLYLYSTLSCLLTSTANLPSNSSTSSFIFSKFSSFFQVSLSIINPFHCTKYPSTPLIFILFNIFFYFPFFDSLYFNWFNFLLFLTLYLLFILYYLTNIHN